jgi:hypothetical protein
VIAVASCISVGEHKGLFVAVPHVFKAFGIVVDLVEEGDKVHRVARGATASIIVAIRRVRNMRFVILRVNVLPIPASRKLAQICQRTSLFIMVGTYSNLHTNLVALLVGQVFWVWPGATPNAFVGNGAAGKVVSLAALHGVASNHAEAGRESTELVIIGAAAGHCGEIELGAHDVVIVLTVINGHATKIPTSIVAYDGDIKETAILRLVIQLWRPIVRHYTM